MEKTCPEPFFHVTQDKTSPKEDEQRSLRSHREIFFLKTFSLVWDDVDPSGRVCVVCVGHE